MSVRLGGGANLHGYDFQLKLAPLSDDEIRQAALNVLDKLPTPADSLAGDIALTDDYVQLLDMLGYRSNDLSMVQGLAL